MAAPHVSAVAALVIEAGGGRMDPDEVFRILKRTADDLGEPGKDAFYGHGRVNAAAAVARARDECQRQSHASPHAPERVSHPLLAALPGGRAVTSGGLMDTQFLPVSGGDTTVGWADPDLFDGTFARVTQYAIPGGLAPGATFSAPDAADQALRARFVVAPPTAAEAAFGDSRIDRFGSDELLGLDVTSIEL